MKITRLSEFNDIEKLAISYCVQQTQKTPKDGVWRTYHGEMKYNDIHYTFKLGFRYVADVFSIKDLSVVHKSERVILLH